ncbi:MAG: hypothetical protein PVH19_11735, partial [Planctomycetia bacterium]
ATNSPPACNTKAEYSSNQNGTKLYFGSSSNAATPSNRIATKVCHRPLVERKKSSTHASAQRKRVFPLVRQHQPKKSSQKPAIDH